MTFQKGESGNPAGKPKGTLDRFTAFKSLLRDALYSRKQELLGCSYEKLLDCWIRLMPKDTSIKTEQDITYISTIPREQLPDKARAIDTVLAHVEGQGSEETPLSPDGEAEGCEADGTPMRGGSPPPSNVSSSTLDANTPNNKPKPLGKFNYPPKEKD